MAMSVRTRSSSRAVTSAADLTQSGRRGKPPRHFRASYSGEEDAAELKIGKLKIERRGGGSQIVSEWRAQRLVNFQFSIFHFQFTARG
jgi:hypothetical protein